ncbi:MAG: methyltransferase, partial [Terracidiphilus sp.]
MQDLWTEVDRYFCDLLVPADEKLEAALAANRLAGLPTIDVSPLQGEFLNLLVRVSGARRILEIGLLGGYSTIWMARALPKGGRIISLEV